MNAKIEYSISEANFTEIAGGPKEKNIRLIADRLHVKIDYDGSSQAITIKGDSKDIAAARDTLVALTRLKQERSIIMKTLDVDIAITQLREGVSVDSFVNAYRKEIAKDAKGATIYAKNPAQVNFLKAVESNDLTFAIGPAGTGKTFLAAVAAVNAFNSKQVEKIILTRPIMEAGENLGFLPGDIKEKVDPYFSPLYQALNILLGNDKTKSRINGGTGGTIELRPLAYMRGCTFDNSFLILDEAQNTTPEQMKMYLTRFGMGSKMVVTGDESQDDLPTKASSGLEDAERRLKGKTSIEFVNFTTNEVVRHPIVRTIIEAYSNSK